MRVDQLAGRPVKAELVVALAVVLVEADGVGVGWLGWDEVGHGSLGSGGRCGGFGEAWRDVMDQGWG